jgi:hypothetical protein
MAMHFLKLSGNWGEYPLLDKTDPAELFGTTRDIIKLDKSVLTFNVLDSIYRLGLEIKEVQVFVSPPMFKMKIHSDGNNANQDLYALNWIIGKSKTWTMEWFNAIEESSSIGLNKIGRVFVEYSENNCTKIASNSWHGPALVNVSVPHRIINASAYTRYCISIRFVNCLNLLNKSKSAIITA